MFLVVDVVDWVIYNEDTHTLTKTKRKRKARRYLSFHLGGKDLLGIIG